MGLESRSGEPMAWSDDTTLLGPDAPKSDSSIKFLIEYLLTVYKRFGNTAVTFNLKWGASALWERDRQAKRIEELEQQLAAASENRAQFEWHPVSELPPKPGQYLCRLPHQFIVCSYEHSPVDGKYHWNYASVSFWAELPEVPK